MLEQTRKFYIMERTDNNGALTFYLNEVGESKNPEKLKDFKEVLQKFLDILKNYAGKALVYFHANWTYRGFATVEQVKKIIEALTANNVENIVIEDITTEEMKNYKVDIVKLERNFDSIDVSYNLIHDKYKSQLYIKTLSNLGKNLEMSKARTINEDIEIKEHQQYVEVRNFKTKVWISVSILIALAILSAIMLVVILLRK